MTLRCDAVLPSLVAMIFAAYAAYTVYDLHICCCVLECHVAYTMTQVGTLLCRLMQGVSFSAIACLKCAVAVLLCPVVMALSYTHISHASSNAYTHSKTTLALSSCELNVYTGCDANNMLLYGAVGSRIWRMPLSGLDDCLLAAWVMHLLCTASVYTWAERNL